MYHENAEWDWGRWSAAEKHSHLLKQRRELDEVDIVVGDRLLHHAEGGRQGGSADRSVWRLTPCSSCAVGAGPPAYVQTLKREAGGCPLRPKSSPKAAEKRDMIITINMFVVVVVMLALTGPVSASDDRGPKVSCALSSLSLSLFFSLSLSLSLFLSPMNSSRLRPYQVPPQYSLSRARSLSLALSLSRSLALPL
jgi:hypothetical protein